MVSGGNADISTTNVEIKIDVAKKFGYEIIQDKYIGPVKPKTPIEDFKTIFSKNPSTQIIVKQGNNIVTTGYMKTGMIVEIIENNNKKEYEVFVIGDANGDGLASSADTRMIKAYRNELLSLNTVNNNRSRIRRI